MTKNLQTNLESMQKSAANDNRRGYDLNIAKNHIPGWTLREGLRELAQNFFDQIVKQRRLVTPQFRASETKYEKAGNRFNFYAYPTDDEREKILLGYMETSGRNARTGVSRIDFLNDFTTLSTKILTIGETDKQTSDDLCGGFGEGLKVGINALLRQPRAEVSYTTNGYVWTLYHRENEHGRMSLHVKFRSVEAGERETWMSKTLASFECAAEPSTFESVLRQSFLFMMPDLQGSFDKFTLGSKDSLGCWTETHLFFDPSLQVTPATMLPPTGSASVGHKLVGSIFCRGIRVTDDILLYYGLGINLEEKSIMTRDRSIVHPRHAYDAVGLRLAKFLSQHPAPADFLKYVFDVLQSLPRRDSPRTFHFGDTTSEIAVNGFRTVWTGLHDHATKENRWLASQLLQQFHDRFGKECFPCGDDKEATKFKEFGLGKGVVLSEIFMKFLKLSGLVQSPEECLEETVARAPVLDVSRNESVRLLCNRLAFAATSGLKSLGGLRNSTAELVRFVDWPLEESKAVYRVELHEGRLEWRILLGNKIDILPIAQAMSRVQSVASARLPDMYIMKLHMIAGGIRAAIMEKNKTLINMPVSSRGSVLSSLIMMLMMRDIEIGRLSDTEVYIARIESKDVQSAVAEPPRAEPNGVPTLVTNGNASDDGDRSRVGGKPPHKEEEVECVATFVVGGEECRIMRKRRRINENAAPVQPPAGPTRSLTE